MHPFCRLSLQINQLTHASSQNPPAGATWAEKGEGIKDGVTAPLGELHKSCPELPLAAPLFHVPIAGKYVIRMHMQPP